MHPCGHCSGVSVLGLTAIELVRGWSLGSSFCGHGTRLREHLARRAWAFLFGDNEQLLPVSLIFFNYIAYFLFPFFSSNILELHDKISLLSLSGVLVLCIVRSQRAIASSSPASLSVRYTKLPSSVAVHFFPRNFGSRLC